MENFHHTGGCPIRDVLSKLGDKWTMLIMVTLKTNGTMRFCDIQKTIGDISQRMLTVTLRSLETDGLLIRKVYAEVPPRVEYSLTEMEEIFHPMLFRSAWRTAGGGDRKRKIQILRQQIIDDCRFPRTRRSGEYN